MKTRQAFGNVIEWYDFMVYIYLSDVIARSFFPTGSPQEAANGTWLIYSVSLIFRPIGSYAFGRMAYSLGPRRAQTLSIIGMGLVSIAFSILPGYQQIRWFSPLLLLIFRCFQVACAASQFTLSTLIMTNNTAISRTSTVMVPHVASCLGCALAGMVTYSGHLFFESSFAVFWRLSFLGSGLLAFVYWLISQCDPQEETPYPQEARCSVWEDVRPHWFEVVLLTTMILSGFAFINIILLSLIPEYIKGLLPLDSIFTSFLPYSPYTLVILMLFLVGFCFRRIDSFGQHLKKATMLSLPLIALATYLISDGLHAFLVGLILSALAYAFHAFSITEAMAELFPPNKQYKLAGLSMNLAYLLACPLPFLTRYLDPERSLWFFHDELYIVALISLVSVFFLKRLLSQKNAISEQIIKANKEITRADTRIRV